MLLIGCVAPIVLLDLAFDGPPLEAPTFWVVVAIGATALGAAFILWRELRFRIREVREMISEARVERDAERKQDGD